MTRHATGLAVLFAALAAAPAAAQGAAAPAPAADAAASALLRSVESHLAGLSSLTASFTQSYRSADLGAEVVESGRLFVKRPGRMRWDYRRPDKKVFLVRADGTTLSWVPADLSAVRGSIPDAAPHLDLLLGRSDLVATFEVERVELRQGVLPGARHLKLTPRKPMAGVEIVYLEVEPATPRLARVLLLDAMGNESDIVLTRVKDDADVDDGAFVLDLPRGTEIRDAAPGTP